MHLDTVALGQNVKPVIAAEELLMLAALQVFSSFTWPPFGRFFDCTLT